MPDNKLTEQLYVSTYSNGIGKQARGHGSIGLKKTSDGQVELSVGRSRSSRYYSRGSASSAWACLTMAEAHELAIALLYLSGNQIPCQGEGVQMIKHKANMKVEISFTTDLCSLLNKGADVKKEVLDVVANKLDTLDLPGKKE